MKTYLVLGMKDGKEQEESGTAFWDYSPISTATLRGLVPEGKPEAADEMTGESFIAQKTRKPGKGEKQRSKILHQQGRKQQEAVLGGGERKTGVAGSNHINSSYR